MWQCGLVERLLAQCDLLSPPHSALVPLTHCLLSPGGPMKFSLEGKPVIVLPVEEV